MSFMNVHNDCPASKRTSSKGVSGPRGSFSVNQLKKLNRALDPAYIHVRDIDSRKISYIEGWFAIAQANEIFGPSAWDREMVHFERVYERANASGYTCGYLARVRIRVRAGATEIVREGTGWGAASAQALSDAHERALKSAETDATKRALATFGNQFGLCLYERAAGVDKLTFALMNAEGALLASSLSPESFCSGLRQLIEICKTETELERLAKANATGIRELKAQSPNLKNKQGEHYADILRRLIEQAREKLQVAERAVGSSPRQVSDAPAGQTISDASSKDVTIGNGELADTNTGGGEARPTLNPRVGQSDPSHGPNDEERAAGIGPSTSPEALAPSRITAGSRIDKSSLVFGVGEKRLRDKQHLKRVAALPCLVCNRQPSHPSFAICAEARVRPESQ